MPNGESIKSWLPLVVGVMGLVMAGVVGFYSAQMAVAQALGQRPTRTEVKEAIDTTQKATQRELEYIKTGQNRNYEALRNIEEALRNLTFGRSERETPRRRNRSEDGQE